MKHTLRIHLYESYYHVEVKRKFLWIFPYWETLYTSRFLKDCENFYQELVEGKHKELLKPSRENWLKNGV